MKINLIHLKEKSLRNKKYNYLKIIKYAYTKNNRSYWKCACSCGNELVASLNNIKQGCIKSCGCIRTHKYKQGESGLKNIFSKYKVAAKKEGRKFNLTLEEFKKITSGDCVYCGAKPNKTSSSEHTKNPEVKRYTAYVYNGIDRINSKRGYEKNNVVSCCRWCNIIKRERTVNELINHVVRIYNYLNKN